MRRRIVHVIGALDRARAARQLQLLAAGLPRDEFDVHVCALSNGPLLAEFRSGQIPVTVIGQQSKWNPKTFARLKQRITQLKPDLVQSWLFVANVYGRAAAIAAGVRNIVASELCVDPGRAWYNWAIERCLARRTKALVVNGRGVCDFYARAGVPDKRLRMIHSCAAPAQQVTSTRDELLTELGLPPDARLIGTVGQLVSRKRVQDLIWATDLIRVIQDHVHLVVLGDGPRRANLERFSRNCQITDHVHFLGGQQEMLRWMPHFDVLWQASASEGLSDSIMQAMTYGIPVVATDNLGNRELVIHGQTGYLVQVGDRAGLARCAFKLLEDRQLAEKLGAAGKVRVEREFPIARMVDAHAELYREIMG